MRWLAQVLSSMVAMLDCSPGKEEQPTWRAMSVYSWQTQRVIQSERAFWLTWTSHLRLLNSLRLTNHSTLLHMLTDALFVFLIWRQWKNHAQWTQQAQLANSRQSTIPWSCGSLRLPTSGPGLILGTTIESLFHPSSYVLADLPHLFSRTNPFYHQIINS